MQNIFFTCILIFFLHAGTEAQDLNLYQWKNLQSVRSGYDVTITPNYIVYNTTVNLMFIDRDNYDNYFYLSKIDGLAEASIQKIIYNINAAALLIYYTSGALDIIDKERNISHVNDIKNNSTLVPDKTILNLKSNGNYIYLCMTFGMIEYDIVNRIFTNTLSVQGGINDVAARGNELFIINKNNLYSFDRSTGANLSYIGNWNLIQQNSSDFTAIDNQENVIYVSMENTLARLESDGDLTTIISFPEIEKIKYIRSDNNYLLISGSCSGNCIAKVILLDKENKRVSFNESIINDNLNAAFTDNAIWFADSYHQFRYMDLTGFATHTIDLNQYSPWSNQVFDLKFSSEGLFAAAGSYSRIFLGTDNRSGYSYYNYNEWQSFNSFNTPWFESPEPILDIVAVDYNEATKELALGSMRNGLIVINGDERKLYNSENSPMIGITGDETTERVADVRYDDAGNLWLAMFGKKQVIVMTPDKRFAAFQAPGNITGFVHTSFDPAQSIRWFSAPEENAVFAYDPGSNLLSSSDDRWGRVNLLSEYEQNYLRPTAMFTDQNGRLWVGTQSGVFTIDCGSSVFGDSCTARQILVPDGTKVAPLLNGAEITTINEDGASRKWIGTHQGIFMLDEYGEEVLLHLTAENSALASNTVNTLEIDQKTGNVYIGTDHGIQVYRTDASIGNLIHDKQLVIYPNPVRPDYHGPIIIKGLAQSTNVKIADVNGRLVFETMSLGSQAIWDGLDFQKRKVASGVYYVLATSTGNLENPEGITGQIVFIK